MAGEATGRLRAQHRVEREGDRAGLRDVEATVLLGGEELVDLRLEVVEVGDERRERRRVDDVGEHEEAVSVERRPLLRA